MTAGRSQPPFGIVEGQANPPRCLHAYDLNTKIRALIDGWNDRSHPFVWTKTADQILAKANPSNDFNPRH